MSEFKNAMLRLVALTYLWFLATRDILKEFVIILGVVAILAGFAAKEKPYLIIEAFNHYFK